MCQERLRVWYNALHDICQHDLVTLLKCWKPGTPPVRPTFHGFDNLQFVWEAKVWEPWEVTDVAPTASGHTTVRCVALSGGGGGVASHPMTETKDVYLVSVVAKAMIQSSYCTGRFLLKSLQVKSLLTEAFSVLFAVPLQSVSHSVCWLHAWRAVSTPSQGHWSQGCQDDPECCWWASVS